MKKLFYTLFLLSLFIIPGKVLAINGSINLNCTPISIFPNDTSTCTIAADVSDGTIKQFSGQVSLSSNLKFVETTVVNGWKGTSANGLFSLTTEEGKC